MLLITDYFCCIFLQLSDLLVIFAILTIFILAYGIATEAMLYPPHGINRNVSSIKRLLSRGYFESLGEPQREELDGMSIGAKLSAELGCSIFIKNQYF